jgi:hypothetical protein
MQLMQPDPAACCILAPFTADAANYAAQPVFVSPGMQQQQQQLVNVPGAVYVPHMMTHGSSIAGAMPQSGLQYVAAGSQAGIHGLMASGNCSSSSSASSSSWAAVPDAVGLQQAHGTVPMSVMMSSNTAAAFLGYLPQQSPHVLQQQGFMQQHLPGHASGGQMPA